MSLIGEVFIFHENISFHLIIFVIVVYYIYSKFILKNSYSQKKYANNFWENIETNVKSAILIEEWQAANGAFRSFYSHDTLRDISILR